MILELYHIHTTPTPILKGLCHNYVKDKPQKQQLFISHSLLRLLYIMISVLLPLRRGVEFYLPLFSEAHPETQ